MTLVKLELRVRDWYALHPLFMSFQVGYNLIFEENFKRLVKTCIKSFIKKCQAGQHFEK